MSLLDTLGVGLTLALALVYVGFRLRRSLRRAKAASIKGGACSACKSSRGGRGGGCPGCG